MSHQNSDFILKVSHLRTRFDTRSGIVRAVDDVSFELKKGQTLGVVGESGSGKSVLFYSILGLIPKPPGRIESGSAFFDGMDLLKMSEAELRLIRGNRVTMIFQDPMTCLNPYLRIEEQLMEPLIIHFKMSRAQARKKALDGLKMVGVPDAERRIRFYPHEFSGGMRQRVMIAMALLTEPELLIADEPTTALDVTVQAQILELIADLQRKKGTSVILVTHDLGVVAKVCEKVLVLYAGKIMENGSIDEMFYSTAHPYTRGLLNSIPAYAGAKNNLTKGSRLYSIPGLPPDVSKEVNGCMFYDRCEYRKPECKTNSCCELISVKSHEHQTSCIRSHELRGQWL